MKKLIMIVALGAAVMATPAFAQYTPGPTTGSAANESEIAHGFYAGNGGHSGRIAANRNGLNAFAMVPSTHSSGRASVNVDNPALTGGGTTGYNEFVRRNW